MIVTVELKKIQEIVDLVSKFVSKHSTLPVLENVFIKGNIDTLLFRATDMEKYIEIEIPALIESEWAITVNAKTFTDIIKSLDDEQIQLKIDENSDTMKVKSVNDEFSIIWISATEYVAVPEISSSWMIEISAEKFSNWISKVEYAVTERNFIPVLTWLLMKVKSVNNKRKLCFAGTDSFRLAEYKVNFDWESNDFSVIIPKLNIWDIKRVTDYYIEKWWENMKISFTENLISFSFDLKWVKILCTSILIQWSFPEYENENIIPTMFNTKVIVDKDQLDKTIKKVSILTRDINNFIEISVDWEKLVVTSWETDKWQAKTTLPAIIEWVDLTFWLNWKYLTDFIRSISSVKLVMNIVSWEKPIVIKNIDDEDYVYVIRPLIK